MLRKQKPLIVLTVISAVFLLCLSVGHCIINAEETQPIETERRLK